MTQNQLILQFEKTVLVLQRVKRKNRIIDTDVKRS